MMSACSHKSAITLIRDLHSVSKGTQEIQRLNSKITDAENESMIRPIKKN